MKDIREITISPMDIFRLLEQRKRIFHCEECSRIVEGGDLLIAEGVLHRACADKVLNREAARRIAGDPRPEMSPRRRDYR